LFQWNKFESTYDIVYSTYCSMTKKNISFIGQKIGKLLKILLGGVLSFGLIILLIIPILLFSSLNPTNELNKLKGAELTVELSFVYTSGVIKNYTLFQNKNPQSIIEMANVSGDWELYGYDKSIDTKNFPEEQIQKVQFSDMSDRNWGLAKSHIQNLINILNWKYENETDLSEIQLILDYQFQRDLPVEAKVAGERWGVTIFSKHENGTIDNESEIGKIRDAISKCQDTEVVFNYVYSAPIRLTADTKAEQLKDDKNIQFYDVFLGFKGCRIIEEENINNYDYNDLYQIDNTTYHSYLESYFTFGKIDGYNKEGLVFHVFSDKVSSTTSGYSLITFYVSFILLAGTYVRNFFAGEPSKITLTEMPKCKEIINLCEGIKISRYSYDFNQEEKLYYILMELMRSPNYLRYLTTSSIEQFKNRKKLTEKCKDSVLEIPNDNQ